MCDLAELTSLRVGGPAARFVAAKTDAEIVAAVRAADEAGEPVLILGGGTNLVVADAGFAGVVVKVETKGLERVPFDCDCGGAIVQVAAGESLDLLVQTAIESEWIGLEALSGIPGTVGAAPVQNVGAYGQELSQTLASIRTWDRQRASYRTFAAADCEFSYRDSRFKREPGRFVILSVAFQFQLGDFSAPIRFGELARRLALEDGGRAPMRDVREAVLALRRGKGMVLDANDHDTWSAGSFFTNPIVSAAVAGRLPEAAPRFEQPDGRFKTSAAWLIDHAGFKKGYGVPPVTLSSKHTLAITNRGGASAAQVIELAAEIQDGVEAIFGIRLVPEPNFIGFG